jgi:hypothetical protein
VHTVSLPTAVCDAVIRKPMDDKDLRVADEVDTPLRPAVVVRCTEQYRCASVPMGKQTTVVSPVADHRRPAAWWEGKVHTRTPSILHDMTSPGERVQPGQKIETLFKTLSEERKEGLHCAIETVFAKRPKRAKAHIRSRSIIIQLG